MPRFAVNEEKTFILKVSEMETKMEFSEGSFLSCEFVSDEYICVNNCGYIRYTNPIDSSRPNGRNDYTIIYVTEGNGFCIAKGKKAPLLGGSLLLLRPREPIVFNFTGKSIHYWLHFTGSAADELLNKNLPQNNGLYQIGKSQELCSLLHNIIFELQINRDSSATMLSGYFLQFLATIGNLLSGNKVSFASNNISKLQPALDEMSYKYFENHSISYYADICNLSPSYFRSQFTKLFNMSPSLYITNLRISHAKEMLSTTNDTIKKIAVQNGYMDSLHFSKVFKTITGISPSEYRKMRKLNTDGIK